MCSVSSCRSPSGLAVQLATAIGAGLLLGLASAASQVRASDTITRALRITFEAARGLPTRSVAVRAVPLPDPQASQPPHARSQRRSEVEGRVAAGGGALTLQVESGTSYVLHTSAEGLWSPPLHVLPDQAEAFITLSPSAEFAATLQPPRGSEMPRLLRLDLRAAPRPAPSGRQPESATIDCPVSDLGHVACAVPAGHFDVRAKAKGFAIHYLWNRSWAPGQRVDLGGLLLREGVSLFGRVTTEEGRVDAAAAEVELRPLIDSTNAGPSERERLRAFTHSTRVSEHGYFSFEGIPPRAYVVTARQPGFSPAVVPNILVETEDTEIGELLLTRPIVLSIAVAPERDPTGKVWTVELYEADGPGEIRIAARAQPHGGHWTFPPRAAGRYWLEVTDGRGDQFLWQEVELTRSTSVLEVELPLVRARGRVTLGSEPLAATLWFGGRHGVVQVKALSNAEGAFEIVLPRPGKWVVDVLGTDSRAAAFGVEVDVEPPRGSQGKEVLIALPNTGIEGVVVNEMGQPIDGASVRLVTLAGTMHHVPAVTGKDGTFAVHGLRPGPLSVEASTETQSSDRVAVSLLEGQTSPPVRLVLREHRKVHGSVVSSSGPIAGAFVLAVPWAAGGTLATMNVPQGRTGVDGRFQLDLPSHALGARLLVLAAGFTLHLSSLVDYGDEPPLVSLTSLGGTLRLPFLTRRDERFGILLVDRQAIDVSLLQVWAETNGHPPGEGSWLVPAMPAGSYAYCELPLEEALQTIGGTGQHDLSTCTQGYLQVGGQLALDVEPQAPASP